MTLEQLLSTVVALVIVGLIVYLLEAYVPMSAPVRIVLRVLVVLLLILWLLRFLAVVAPLHAQGLSLTAAAATGPEAAYAMSNPTDASGHGRTATFTNTMTVPGKYAEAQRFNGTSARMAIATLQPTTAFTLEAWVNLAPTATHLSLRRLLSDPRAAATGWQAIIYKGVDNFFLATAGGYLTAGLTSSTGLHQVVAPSPLPEGEWIHVAATYTGANFYLFMNGLIIASTGGVTGAIVPSSQPVEIGGSAVDHGWLNGVVDDVRIYHRDLTAAEIAVDLATPVDTMHEAVVSWDLEVYSQDAPLGSGGSPVATGNFPKTGALCNQAPQPPPVRTVQNPTTARVSDPIVAGRECELTIESFVLGLPIHAGYTSTARARGATTVSAPSPVSNAFDRVAVTTPPPAPGSTIIAK